MAGGLVALLDDVAALVKATAASLDDVGLLAGKASAKAMGVVVDDAAVTPRYVEGLSANRELPIIWKIALGSIRNKMLFILPIALLLSAFAPWALTPILMVGGLYLAFEGAEKIMEKLHWISHHEAEGNGQKDEKTVISGAVRTDLILSAEIMVIALNEVDHEPVFRQAIILTVVAFLITILVYGVVALIVKMDDIGLKLAVQRNGAVKTFGRGLVKAMPIVMAVLANVGIIAMMWVGGHILLVGTNDLGLTAPYELVHHWEVAVHDATGGAGAVLGWLVNTLCSAIIGFVIGAAVVGVVMLVRRALPQKQAAAHGAEQAAAEPTGKDTVPDAARPGSSRPVASPEPTDTASGGTER
ncbi:DUF808 domain-containing protein [Galactobacter caseinivorans]|uniref:DUF808 domain-containing protein n=1 Tax=Galactobacter caseinivorans TaxID=2676123 RepID=A0A496PKW5_9MICC|nr:DUF808 domain-containing protein [Galactobacter caseinivorans]RKW71131.1 DUF808 domain-containing protein [Galactobacter caseinivorans]